MREVHYIEDLSGFINHELSKEQRQTIAEHLMLCEECRREHDAIKLGSSLARHLRKADAPDSVWTAIERSLDPKPAPLFGLVSQASFFSLRGGLAFAIALLGVFALASVVYLNLFSGETTYIAQNQPPVSNVVLPTSDSNQVVPANTVPAETNANIAPNAPQSDVASWQVETIDGTPQVGTGTETSKIAVGESLETDGRSRVRITVANIGNVEISPNSRVKLIGTGENEHRLSLERGKLHAKIFAPPRLFVVDTPSGKAVDLGCEYTLDVDKQGNSTLHVTGGYVALERGGRESIVPAGMMCMTKRGRGLGTPFAAESTTAFREALSQFDFAGGGSSAIDTVLREANFYDMLTLWHLLSRVSKNERGAVFDSLAKHVAPPAGVTREGVILLNRDMIEKWRAAVETAWFE